MDLAAVHAVWPLRLPRVRIALQESNPGLGVPYLADNEDDGGVGMLEPRGLLVGRPAAQAWVRSWDVLQRQGIHCYRLALPVVEDGRLQGQASLETRPQRWPQAPLVLHCSTHTAMHDRQKPSPACPYQAPLPRPPYTRSASGHIPGAATASRQLSDGHKRDITHGTAYLQR